MSRQRDRKNIQIQELMEIGPANEYGVTFFNEKTLNKLTNFELTWLKGIVDNYYVPRIKPIQDFSSSFSCPVCQTRFRIKAVE
jgi:hypothetical protein